MRMVSARTLFLAIVLLGDPSPAYTQLWNHSPWERQSRLALEPRVTRPDEGEVVAGDLVIEVRVPPEANAREFLVEAAYWDPRSKNWIPAGPLGPEFPGSTTASMIVSSDVRAKLNSTATRWRIHVRVISPPGNWGAWCEFAWKPATPPEWPPPAQGSAFPVRQLDQPATSTNPPGASPEHFLALDLFVGAVGSWTGDDPSDESPESWGWDTGATVVFPVRWFGLTGAFGHHLFEGVSIYQFVVGPQYQSKWFGSDLRVRYFGEFLIGVARSTGVAPPQSNLEWILGFGFDFSFVRMKVEWVEMNTNGPQPRSTRMYIGGVLPICLRACEDSDRILSGR